MSPPAKKPAYTTHPLIEAILAGLYRLPDAVSAEAKLAQLASSFIVPKIPLGGKGELVLWVKGYALTEEEKTLGFLGHFAAIRIVEKEPGCFTLAAHKYAMELGKHPQRKYQNTSRMANWGHPILRGVKKGARYESQAAAEGDLAKLHSQFPHTSIPGVGKLYLMIFARTDEGTEIQKYRLETRKDPDGTFSIIASVNEANPKKSAKKKPLRRQETVEEGHFTTMLARKRKRRS